MFLELFLADIIAQTDIGTEITAATAETHSADIFLWLSDKQVV